MANDIPAEDKLESADDVAEMYDSGDEQPVGPTADLSDGDEEAERLDLDELEDDGTDDHKHPDGQLDSDDDEKAAF